MREDGIQKGASGRDEAGEPQVASTLLRVAWLSILLGIALEVALVAVAAGAGRIPGLQPVAADLVQKISWSVIVCVGLALGKAVSGGQAVAMGVAGLLAAPAAFNAARTLHRSAAQALKAAEPGAGPLSPLFLAGLKGVEYALLGMILAALGKRSCGASAHAGAGALLGALFATAIVVATYRSAPEPPPLANLLSQWINEFLFPIGCSLVIFLSHAFGRREAR